MHPEAQCCCSKVAKYEPDLGAEAVPLSLPGVAFDCCGKC